MKLDTVRDYHQRIENVLQYVLGHLEERIELLDAARIACLSPYHFFRVFQSMVGETFGKHVRRLKLERSAYLLVTTEQQIVMIAFDAGYETHQSFSRAFKELFGLTPLEYRRKYDVAVYPQLPTRIHYSPDGKLSQFVPFYQGGIKIMEVKIVKLPELRVACMRHHGAFNKISQTFKKFKKWLRKHPELLRREDFMVLGIFHEDSVGKGEDELRSECAITVDETFQPDGEVELMTVPASEYAMTVYRGPYKNIPEAWTQFISEGLPRTGRKSKGTLCLENYPNDPATTKPEDLITELYEAVE